MKRIIALLLVIIFTAGILTGCGGETASSAPSSSEPEKPAASQEAYKPAEAENVSVMEELRKLKQLEGKNIKLVDVYNEVANLVIKNGWDKDELTLKELNIVKTTIQSSNTMLKKPSTAHGVDLDAILVETDKLIIELDTNIRTRVSVPCAK